MKVWQLAWGLLLVVTASFADARLLGSNVGVGKWLWGHGRRVLGLLEELPDPSTVGSSWQRKMLDTGPGMIRYHEVIFSQSWVVYIDIRCCCLCDEFAIRW